MREGLPTTAKTDDLDVVLTAAISDALDDCVEAGDVAATRMPLPASLDWHVVIT